ncbi:hypothetical protein [Aneurinibacillus migulanus]|uniref:Phage XkdN-like tail assembly chaperone protein, TAC n=1 Tax=Aneurinibacillus migulanus TaxID=47500 RepID=A0A0D1WG37_ANEMI|nr:hypothetical protein [Aneurinibacillus migulanus]KIV57500.1 hypothetical protein TS65_09745 [Aneurinibacillus migulanus]KON94886.1 hypothetical protein AF333_04680 [Aneurinibacillus migulanus]MED0892844.1 hypothetical protein [Aneurinibacillus migulanus]MED1619090.1 hypothetical protein [Aneurinibacillus migulanus]SDI92803.1 hypothetical protein SAMN04487909_109122 [Aneurinibacillus migulanus]
MAIVNIQDVIAKRKAKVEEKIATVYIPSLEGEIKIKAPSREDLREYDHALVYERTKENDSEVLQKATEKIILRNVVEPNLKDKDLIEALGCKKNPSAVVQEFFEVVEIPQVALFILNLAGRDNAAPVRLVDDLKN